jgi:glycosyltransferase involved in cell wall biosynthesis
VPALAQAIVSLVRDPERRRRLGCKGRERAQEFSWPRVTDRIESVYRRVLERRRGTVSAA